MKVKFVSSLLCLLLSVTACVKENLDDCPDEEITRLVLQFEYDDLTGKDVFDQRIEMIDVALFDASQTLVSHDSYRRTSLTDRSVEYILEAGTYYVVCWGDITAVGQELPAVDSRLGSHLGELVIHHTGNGVSPMHYAPDYRDFVRPTGTTRAGAEYDIYKVEVEPGKTTYKTEAFMCAYRTINVYISGIEGLLSHPSSFPFAGIKNMQGAYDYYLQCVDDLFIDIEKITTEVEIREESYARASFYVPHFEALNNYEIYITGNIQNASFYEKVMLEDFLRDNDISVYDGDELVIDICFKYLNNVFVGVENPGWNDDVIFPEF